MGWIDGDDVGRDPSNHVERCLGRARLGRHLDPILLE
jgi:hypothetical protein